MVKSQCINGSLGILQVSSVLLVVFVVIYGVEELAWSLLLCLDIFDSLHIGLLYINISNFYFILLLWFKSVFIF